MKRQISMPSRKRLSSSQLQFLQGLDKVEVKEIITAWKTFKRLLRSGDFNGDRFERVRDSVLIKTRLLSYFDGILLKVTTVFFSSAFTYRADIDIILKNAS